MVNQIRSVQNVYLTCLTALGICVWMGMTEVQGQDDAPPVAASSSPLESAIAWTDQHIFQGFRIQQHADSLECRLLDEENETHLTASFQECLAELDRIKHEQNLQPIQGKAVLLLHGLAAPRWSMQLLARHLEKHTDYHGIVVEYASTRSTIDLQARGLANVIRGLTGVREISMVGHSMGNIVIRRYLAGDNTPQGWQADPRIGRIVMIAPPNHGSIAATQLSDNFVFKKVLGQSGRQLGTEWEDLEKRLAVPRCEFGILAGGFGNPLGLNPFVPGDDDGRISVETTRLAGATDFAVVSAVHEFIANDPRVFNMTRQFLTSGYFVSPEQRQEIPSISVSHRPHRTIR